MREAKLSRRDTLKVLGCAPVLAAVISACGEKTAPDSCTDVSALSEPEKMARNALQYVDKSPFPDKLCSGCNLYVAAPSPAECGTCKVVKGPIHPQGHCTSWAKKV